jgi:hypothetical protein
VKFHLVSTGQIARFEGGSQSYVNYYNGASPVGYFGNWSGGANDFDIGTNGANTTGNLNLVTQAISRMTINKDGHVGIGTTMPNAISMVTIPTPAAGLSNLIYAYDSVLGSNNLINLYAMDGNGIEIRKEGFNYALHIVKDYNASSVEALYVRANLGSGPAAHFISDNGYAAKFDGAINITDGTQAAGDVLTTDASGNASWQSSVGATGFRASASGAPTLSGSTVIFGTLDFGSGYNIATGEWTVPSTGVYHIDASVVFNGGTAAGYQRISVYSAGNYLASSTVATATPDHTCTISTDLQFTAGDIVVIDRYAGGATLGVYNGGNFFSAHKIY